MTRENLLSGSLCLRSFYDWTTQKIGSEPNCVTTPQALAYFSCLCDYLVS